MRPVLFVCHSFVLLFVVCLSVGVCLCKSNKPISLKLGVMIGLTNRKKWLSFGSDAVPDTDSGSLFHFPHHCGMRDFRRFISTRHAVSGRFSRPAK